MTGAYSDIAAVRERGLQKLGGPAGEEAFVELCATSKNRARDQTCRRWTLSYEEYFVLREHFGPRVAAKWMAQGFGGNFTASSLPPGDRE